jgi:hypothetical protein
MLLGSSTFEWATKELLVEVSIDNRTKFRNPRSERRPKSEIRNPNPGARPSHGFCAALCNGLRIDPSAKLLADSSDFGLRPSFGIRISDFGLLPLCCSTHKNVEEPALINLESPSLTLRQVLNNFL